MNSKLRALMVYGGLALLLLAPRLPDLGSFVTADEPYWLSMGANFYYALGQRQFENTVYEYQPAVTTMWIVTLAMLVYFPQYRGLGQGYLEFEKGLLDPFLLEHGRDPLVLLQISRLVQVLVVVGLLLVSFYLLKRLVGTSLAFFGIALVSLDPFFLGHSRLLDHEAMLAGFILISILALAVYLLQERKLIFLLLSAAAGGLAQLTKSSGIALLASIAVLLLIYILQNRAAWKTALIESARALGIWLLALVLTYVLVWPGMWVAPGKMLQQVYGNAFSYAFQGARLIALEETQPPPASLSLDLGGFLDLVNTMLWHTTLVTWVGLLLVIVFVFWRGADLIPAMLRQVVVLAGSAGLAFLIIFAVAQGRNSPHYLLTSYVMFNLLAAIGWFAAARWLSTRLHSPGIPLLAVAALLLLQAGSAFISYYPYYFTFQNRLLSALRPRSSPLFAYGEGLEKAGQYLNTLPGAQDSTALVYYSRGCFSYFFRGTSTRFKPYYADEGHEQELKEALEQADYLVLYPAIQRKTPRYKHLYAALAPVEPIQVISLNGYDYVLIYAVESIPAAVYQELTDEPQ